MCIKNDCKREKEKIMVLTRNKLFENIEDFIMALLIIFSSLYSIFELSKITYLDELLIFMLFCVSIFRNKTLKIETTGKLILVYLGYATVVSIFNLVNIFGFIESIPFTIKVPFVFFTFTQLKISDERRNKLLMIFFLANIPSMIRGMWQYTHRSLGWALGLKMRNGTIRVMGCAAHPIWFAFSMIIMIIITLSIFKVSQKYKILSRVLKILLVAAMLFLIYVSQTRYAIAVLLIIAYSWILMKSYHGKKAFTFLLVFLGIVIALFYGWSIFQDVIGTDSETVRSQGLAALPKAIYNYPFGSGLGTFGNKESVVYHSKVYSTLGMGIPSIDKSFNSGNVFESMLVQRVVETGVLGTICYVMIFLYPLKSYKLCNDSVSVLILLTFFWNSVMNVAYQLPLIVVAGIAFSNINYNKKMHQTKKMQYKSKMEESL